MLGADWEEELKDIVGGGGNNNLQIVIVQIPMLIMNLASQDDGDHQYMMFSATFPKEARELARAYMSDNHIRIRVGRAGSAHMNVVQEASTMLTDNQSSTLTYSVRFHTRGAKTASLAGLASRFTSVPYNNLRE